MPRLIGFCPVCVSWQKRSVTAPFGHRLSDELSEIILDYLHFDHRLTTTVQRNCKTPKKPVVTTNNGLFLVLAVNVHNQQILRFIVSLYHSVVVLRLNTYFQLRYFIFCTTKIAVLSFVFMSCCSIFSSLLRVVFCDVELR
ncbi:MAG: hypothetical protein PUE97_02000, partial [Subdoligranulum variabile]|nr:hypothetical protein [Subdoligranulum variabile]